MLKKIKEKVQKYFIPATIASAVVGGGMALILSVADNARVDDYNSPGKLEFTLIEAGSQDMRGSADFQGGGNFLDWSQSGSASFGSGQGRLAVKTTLEGNERFYDIEITRSEYLSLKNNETDTITINVEYEPCYVETMDNNLVCYRFTRGGRYVKTNQDFKAHRTVFGADIDDHRFWLAEHAKKKLYNGYFGNSDSYRIITEAVKRLGEE